MFGLLRARTRFRSMRRQLLPSFAAILALQQWTEAGVAQQVMAAEAVAEARTLVDGYYERLLTPDCVLYVSIHRGTPGEDTEAWLRGLFAPLCNVPPACKGTSQLECMGGETLCISLATRCNFRASVVDRQRVLGALEPLRRAAPESDWLVGQTVNLALKNRQLGLAQQIAESCGGSPWWCSALRGYVSHVQSRGQGELQLDSALRSAPVETPAWEQGAPEWEDPGLYCVWTDISPLLTGSLLNEYGDLECGMREAFESRFWWLADPLWTTPENERRAEHLARNVQLRLDGAVRRLSPAYHASVIPAGWPNSWRAAPRPLRGPEDPGRMTEELLIRHELYVDGGYRFTPDEARFRNPVASTAEDWAVEWGEGEERLFMAKTWYDLDHHQTAVLRRGEELLVVSAARLPVITESVSGVTAALAMARPQDQRVEVVPAELEATGVVRVSTLLDGGEWLAGIEMQGSNWVGRVRQGAPAPDLVEGFGVSVPVLVDERAEQPELPVARTMLPSTDLFGRDQRGLYFEVYGVEQDESLRVSVAVERTDRSLISRLANLIGFSSSNRVAVDWSEPAPSAGMMNRYLSLDVGRLEEGKYRISVTVERENGQTATSSRAVTKSRN